MSTWANGRSPSRHLFQSILGSDFLADAYLAANHRDALFMDLSDGSTIAVSVSHDEQPMRISFVEQFGPYWDVLNSFPTLSKPTFDLKQPAHGIQHHIPTMGALVQVQARKLAPASCNWQRNILTEWKPPIYSIGVRVNGPCPFTLPPNLAVDTEYAEITNA